MTMPIKPSPAKPRERKKLPLSTVTLALTESGYRCAVPTCRGILALDMHHLWEVAAGGGDESANLIALCPTCHALYHRGTISQESIYAYKSMLVAIGRAFDVEAVDRLLFLSMCPKDYLVLSGDGVLHFSRLIAAGLVAVEQKANNAWQLVTYAVNISAKGRMLMHAHACLATRRPFRNRKCFGEPLIRVWGRRGLTLPSSGRAYGTPLKSNVRHHKYVIIN